MVIFLKLDQDQIVLGDQDTQENEKVVGIIVERIIEIINLNIDHLEVITSIDLQTTKNQIEINNGNRY